jgi:hypothetical protein
LIQRADNRWRAKDRPTGLASVSPQKSQRRSGVVWIVCKPAKDLSHFLSQWSAQGCILLGWSDHSRHFLSQRTSPLVRGSTFQSKKKEMAANVK